MPADPGANLGRAKLPTKEADIGHVAPSFEDKKRYNTLLVRAEYRVSLKLGKLENLFLHPAKSKRGRMERMQVLGLFYFPLSHSKAETAFDGEPASGGKAAVMGTWEYYKTEILGVGKGDDDAADADIQTRLQRWVVQKLNDKEGDSCYTGEDTPGGGELPVPAEEKDDKGEPKPDVAKGHFGKIRVPGSYAYIETTPLGNYSHDGKYPLSMDPLNLYNAQEWCLQDNPVLGAIPLVATVERRESSSGEWKPAKGKMVYFQLVKPYDLPAYNDKISPSAQANRPPLRTTDMQTGNNNVGPALQEAKVAQDNPPTANDPQVDNCLSTYGGKRGLDVAGNLFELKMEHTSRKDRADGKPVKKVDRPGFYADHADAKRKGEIKDPLFKKPKKAEPAGDHPHAVQAETNDNGEAGVIFRPSLAGGDRYRIRAYVGPPTLKGPGSNGEGVNAVAVETGTLVVWRNLRISRILKLPCATVNADVVNDIKTHFAGGNANHPLIKEPAKYLKYSKGTTTQDTNGNFLAVNGYGGTFAEVGYDKLDFSRGRIKDSGNVEYKYDGFIKEVGRSFCEVDFDEEDGDWFGDPPEGTDDWEDDWDRAVEETKKILKSSALYRRVQYTTTTGAVKNVRINVDKFFDSNVSFEDCYGLVPLKMPKVYNSSVASGSQKIPLDGFFLDPRAKKAFDSWFDDYVLTPFVSSIIHKGYLPGLSVIQVPTISVWHATFMLGDYAIGLGFRCCVLAWGKDTHPTTKRQELTGAVADWDKKTEKYKEKRRNNTGPVKDVCLRGSSYSSLLLHELGHCTFHNHAPPHPTTSNNAVHDRPQDGWCVMTYCPCEGDFCGRCALVLRGWKSVNTLPRPSP